MYRFNRQRADSLSRTKLLAWALSAAMMVSSWSAFADLESNGEQDVLMLALPDTSLGDDELSLVEGMGAEHLQLDAGNAVAVILWDEGNSTSRRDTHNRDASNSNFQSVSITVNRH